jgi:hypothetical protein
MNLYAVFADYRKDNEHRYPYYVRANSIREARTKFQDKISWLTILKIEPVTDKELCHRIFSNPLGYIFF